jgi:hypothetical protein
VESAVSAVDLEALVVTSPWRVGRSLGRSVYARVGDDLDGDVFVGLMETRALAAQVVADHNAVITATKAAS